MGSRPCACTRDMSMSFKYSVLICYSWSSTSTPLGYILLFVPSGSYTIRGFCETLSLNSAYTYTCIYTVCTVHVVRILWLIIFESILLSSPLVFLSHWIYHTCLLSNTRAHSRKYLDLWFCLLSFTHPHMHTVCMHAPIRAPLAPAYLSHLFLIPTLMHRIPSLSSSH